MNSLKNKRGARGDLDRLDLGYGLLHDARGKSRSEFALERYPGPAPAQLPGSRRHIPGAVLLLSGSLLQDQFFRSVSAKLATGSKQE